MKIDVTQKLMTFDEKELLQKDENGNQSPISLRDVLMDVLLNPPKNDSDGSGVAQGLRAG
jgi:hypothetical protein